MALALASVATPIGFAGATTLYYSDFADASAFTFNGVTATAIGTTGQTVLRLTPNRGGTSGAAYISTPITLGPKGAFETTFQFQITGTPNQEWSDGMTFLLTGTPANIGTSNQTGGSIGYQDDRHSVAVIFDTYRYNNVVAAVPNGDLNNVTDHLVNSWAYPYGQNNCNINDPGQSGDGCLIDGDIWTARIKYDGGILNAWVEDGTGPTYQVITNFTVSIQKLIHSGPLYVGFTAGTGGGYANYDVLDWEMRY